MNHYFSKNRNLGPRHGSSGTRHRFECLKCGQLFTTRADYYDGFYANAHNFYQPFHYNITHRNCKSKLKDDEAKMKLLLG